MMMPASHMPSMIDGAAYGSSSALSLGQGSLPKSQQQIPATAAAESGDTNCRMARRQDMEQLGDEVDSRSGSENVDGDELPQDPAGGGRQRKRYHRHTQHQIQELEASFKKCPHPDDKQRKELSRELGLEPLQIKFWFQNKRTQIKNNQEKHENTELREENDQLRGENMRYKEALSSAICPSCGGAAAVGDMSLDDHQLRVENARLREEVDRISAIAAKYVGQPAAPFPVLSTPLAAAAPAPVEHLDGAFLPGVQPDPPMLGGAALVQQLHLHLQQWEDDKSVIVELAVAAMEELVRMAQMGEPLWIRNNAPAADGAPAEKLSEEEYARMFPGCFGPRMCGLSSEVSRHSAAVIITPATLVEILMDVNQYAAVFSSIVSRAAVLEVLSTGVAGCYNGVMQVMSMEVQAPSPFVPKRESYFVRYCKQDGDGSWVVVDVSLDDLRPSPALRCRRRPSGCLVEELPNGGSKVTWVEHVEVDDTSVDGIYKLLVSSGLAFGARRWVAELNRQCERLASVMAGNIPTGDDIGVITSPEGRRSTLKLAERIMVSFYGGLTASDEYQWTTISGGGDNVRVMTRKSVGNPGKPPGVVLSAATSFWLPVPPRRVFDHLRDETYRREWDILSNGAAVQKIAHVANGLDHGNCVSLLRVTSTDPNQGDMLILQESCTDASGSYVVYAPVDIMAMNAVLNGGNPDYIVLLPSGFAILPDGPAAAAAAGGGDHGGGGSLLTVAFQVLVDPVPTADVSAESVTTVSSLIACTVERIKAAVSGETSRQ